MAGRRHARENGWRFPILTEKELRSPDLGNAAFLARFRDWPRDERHEEHLVHRLAITLKANAVSRHPRTLLQDFDVESRKSVEFTPDAMSCLDRVGLLGVRYTPFT